MRIDALIRLAFAGEVPPEQNAKEQESKNNSQLSTLNSQLIEKVSVQLNAEKLKLIDEISRLILELKKEFPELARNLEKAREHFSANQENIPAKKILNLFSTIQQNLSEKTVVAETIRNLVGEAVKILQPKLSMEIPQETKLILVLSKNDFEAANTIIKNITSTPTQTSTPTPTSTPTSAPTPTPVQQQTPMPTPMQQPQQIPVQPLPQQTIPQQIVPQVAPPPPQQTFQAILNTLQEFKELGIPKELQRTPLKELETMVLQKTGIEIPKDLVKNLSIAFGEKPVFAEIIIAPVPQKEQAQQQPQIIPQQPQVIQQQPQIIPQQLQAVPQQPQIIPQQPQIVPQQPQVIQQQPQINPQQPQIIPQQPQVIPQQPQAIPQQPQIIPQQPQIIPQQPQAIPQQPLIIPQQPQVIQQQPQITQQQPQIIPQQPQVAVQIYEIPLPKNFPLEKILPIDLPAKELPPKIELAFSLYQIPENKISEKPEQPKAILQPWPASVSIPQTERNFWIKTDLPFTPQTLNIREMVLSFNSGKLPENPEIVRSFASAFHEVSMQTEQGSSIPKEQVNLLWRAVNNMPVNLPLPMQITHTFLKYQPQGNYEGELFKSLPEPVKKELLQELPKEKTLQPEILQKAVERILEKAPEETRPVLQNLKEQIQWTRVDQDTRVQSDRDNIFYFMHEGELQKGRLKVKDERKGNSKNKQDSQITFSIDTKVKNLGNVHVDLTLSKGILNIRMQDEVGTASDAVNEERGMLAKELADLGISLGELVYGKTPKIQIVKVAEKTEKSTGGLDVKA